MAELPMFPLGTTLLPDAALPLQVFEPRYRELLERVLDDDGAFGIVLIRRGQEVGGSDERFTVGTRARIVRARELPDGRWTLLVRGERRIAVERWLPDAPFPRAEVVEREDRHDDERLADVHSRLAPRLERVLELQRDLDEEPAPDPGTAIVDDPSLVCWHDPALCPLTPLDRQRLLETDDCVERLELLDDLLVGAEEVLTFRLLT